MEAVVKELEAAPAAAPAARKKVRFHKLLFL